MAKEKLPVPDIYTLLVGKGESSNFENAKDAAKLKAGVNFNLLQASSILPPGAKYLTPKKFLEFVPKGAIVPAAFGIALSKKKNEKIAAAVGVGIPKNSKHFGMIMEYHGYGKKQANIKEAKKITAQMIRESFSFKQRKKINLQLKKIKVLAINHVVKNCGCVIAMCPMWFKKSNDFKSEIY